MPLPRILHRPHLADQRHLDLAGVLHLFLDLLGDVAGDLRADFVVDELGVDDHADFAAGLDGVGLANAVEAEGKVFEVAEALHVALERLASRARAGRADRVGGHDDGRVRRRRRHVAVVAGGGVEHRFGLVEAAQEVHADLRVTALGLVVHRLANVVQQPAAPRELPVEPELVGDRLGKVCDFQTVPQDVLPVACAVTKAAEHRDDWLGDVREVRFRHRLLADLRELIVHLLARDRDDPLDARRVDAAVLNEPLEADARDLAAHRVEAAHDDDARRVVDDHVHARRLLEAADVAALAADHAALHVVAGDRHRADRVVGRLLRGVLLDGGKDDLAALVLRLFLGLLGHALDDRAALAARFFLDAAEEQFFRLLGRNAGDLQQSLALLGEDAGQLRLLLRNLFIAVGERVLQVVELAFLDRERVELSIQHVLALVEPVFVLLELAPGALVLLLELLLQLELFLAVLELDLLGLVGGFEARIFAELFTLLARSLERVFSREMNDREDAAPTENHSDQQVCDIHSTNPFRAPRFSGPCDSAARGRAVTLEHQ